MNIVLLTSTIQPKGDAYNLQHHDAALRMADYEQALAFYAQLVLAGTITQLIYVDNSGCPLDRLHAVSTAYGVGDRVEFVSYLAPEAGNNQRMYLELRLIEQAFGRSKILQANPEALIWKVTGRYIVHNLQSIFSACAVNGPWDAVLHHRRYPRSWVDFYLAAFTRSAWQQIFSSQLAEYQNDESGEIVLFRRLTALQSAKLRVLCRLPQIPRVSGVRGYDGAVYGEGQDRLKWLARAALNRLVPKLWI